MTSLSGLVCNIQRFSLHDGPGIRTTVFLKGCTLRCFWCHNPESIRLTQELRLYPDRCIGCGACVEVCPTGAQGLSPEGELQFDRERCQACGACVEVCFAGARELSARRMTVPEVVAEVLQDRAFYESSRGGVTLSGGEPALQPEFSYEILAQCREAGVHTAIETAANVRWENLARLMPVTDMVMMDLKQMDPQKHRWATGATNTLLLANARRLVETGKPIVFRTPVVPTVNDTPEEIAAIAAFVREMVLLRRARGDADGDGVGEDTITLELLPFHRLAGDKYRSLGLDYRATDLEPPTHEVMEALTATAAEQGITVHHR
ncbi:MAG TPA: glycyl-radical enzyme activating protein [Chloroflexi bacterium]|nr:glycyl-radical enzyme activating protein [Chloroflexota bacterium]